MTQSAGFRKYLNNFSWLFVDRVVRMGLILATTIIVSRYLGVERIGQLNYALAIVSIAMVLTSLGANEIVARDLVRHPERRDELLGSTFAIKLAGGIALNVGLFIYVLVKGMDAFTVLLVMITASAELLKWSTVIDYYFMAQVRGNVAAKVNIASTLISSGYKLLLVWYQAPLIWFAWGYFAETLTYTLGFVWVYQRNGLRLRSWKPRWRMVRYILDQSWPMLLYGFALQAQLKIDQVMIKDLLSSRLGETFANIELGQYSIAVKMLEAIAFMPLIVQLAVAPAIAKARIVDVSLYHERLTNQYRLMFAMFLVTAIPMYFLSEWGIVLLYGEEFREAGRLLALFAFRLVFSYMGVAKGSFITNESLFKFSLITSVLGAVINISLNAWLIPWLGARGAIWASAISFFVSIFVVDLFTARTRINFRLMMNGMLTFWKLRAAK